MKLPAIPRVSDHGSEIVLLGIIAAGVLILCAFGLNGATSEKPFDPSAYLVVLTLIVGAIKERWTQRSVDRMGQNLAAAPATETATGKPNDPVHTVEETR